MRYNKYFKIHLLSFGSFRKKFDTGGCVLFANKKYVCDLSPVMCFRLYIVYGNISLISHIPGLCARFIEIKRMSISCTKRKIGLRSGPFDSQNQNKSTWSLICANLQTFSVFRLSTTSNTVNAILPIAVRKNRIVLDMDMDRNKNTFLFKAK